MEEANLGIHDLDVDSNACNNNTFNNLITITQHPAN